MSGPVQPRTDPSRGGLRSRGSSTCALVVAPAAILAAASFGSGAVSPLQAATMVTVTSSSDVVNGDISSATSLNARPGPDGISLREAILATNATAGAQTIDITFAPAMADRTISLGSHLPGVRRDHVRIVGLLSAEGQPSVTIDARQASRPGGAGYVLLVHASQVTIRQLHFTGVDGERMAFAIGIVPGRAGPQYPPGPERISDVRVEDNLLDNRGFDFPRGGPRAGGIQIRTESFSPNTHIARVTVARNTFLNYSGNAHAVGLSLGGDRTSITAVAVRQNRFERTDCCAIELSAPSGDGGRISGTEIVGNTFDQNFEALSLNISASDVVFEDTLVAGNVISASGSGTINISAGNPFPGEVPTGNVIRRTRIVNNVLTEVPNVGIAIIGGDTATGNRIEGVELWNNTIVSTSPSALLWVFPNLGGAVGNTIDGVVVRNSIFWAPGDNFGGDVTPEMVRSSLTTMPGFAGLNGNVSDDPRFVNPGGGDFRLQAGSPAIDAGTNDGAPRVDGGGHGRVDDPATANRGTGALPFMDMGAFEHLPAGGGAPCVATASALCLGGGRFRVEAEWSTTDGVAGDGRAVPLTADTGYFWFFGPDNVEIVLKVLDACGLNDRFWVFAAGLTDVRVALTVTDTLTGAAWVYSKPLGQAFPPRYDVEAFATCGGAGAAAERTAAGSRSWTGSASAADVATPCVPGETTLCLAGGRFEVQASWRTRDGNTGTGKAVALTADTGYFWFFGAGNVEVVLKVIDACALSAAPRFWVFAAGLTDVEVSLRVTDTANGEAREYRNPLSQPFQPILDTGAFRTCS